MSVRAAAAVVTLGVAAFPAHAAFTAAELTTDQQILSQYNLINFGNYYANNETEGAIAVGGNFIANSSHNAGFNGGGATPIVNGLTFGEVTVFGGVSGGFSPTPGATYIQGGILGSATFQLNNGGAFNIEGSSAGATINGAGTINTTQSALQATVNNTASGNIHKGLSAATVFPFGSFASTFQTPLSDFAAALANLPTAAGVQAQALPSNTNNLNFTANADYASGGKTYGVITTTLANLATEQNFVGINDNGNSATIVVVTGNSSAALPTLNGNDDESKVIWDFVDATSLNFGGQWFGTVLAPNATFADSNNLTGPVVVQSLIQNAELHVNNNSYLFKGDLSGLSVLDTPTVVPEPASIALVGTGVVGLILARRRRARRT